MIGQHSASRKSIRGHLLAGVAVFVFLTAGVGGWAATTEISGAIIAPGSVVVDSNGARSTATSIVFGSAILGPIDNIDTLAKTLVVLGQTVDVTPTTVFDSSLNGGLVALSVGDVWRCTRKRESFPTYGK